MSCAVFTILTLYVLFKGKGRGFQFQAYRFIAAALLFIASYQTWHGEYTRSYPGLRLSFEALNIGNRPNSSDATVLLLASVANVGPPTIADHWKLSIISPSGVTKTVWPSTITQKQPINLDFDGGPSMSYSSADALYLKTPTTPVSTGSKYTGFLSFDVPQSNQMQLEIPGTVYRLSCTDVFNHLYSIDYVSRGRLANGMPFIPGITEPSAK